MADDRPRRVEDVEGPPAALLTLVEHLCIDGTIKDGTREKCCLAEWKAAGA